MTVAALIFGCSLIAGLTGYLIGGWHERAWQRERRGGMIEIPAAPVDLDNWMEPRERLGTSSLDIHSKHVDRLRRPT